MIVYLHKIREVGYKELLHILWFKYQWMLWMFPERENNNNNKNEGNTNENKKEHKLSLVYLFT